MNIDIKKLVEDMIEQAGQDGNDVKTELENYWSMILLDNLPELEESVKKELLLKGYKV